MSILPRNIGKFLGCYFQVLAWLSIASIIIGPIFFDRLHIDLTFILFFWTAGHLIQHNPTARKWTIRITGLCIAVIALLLTGAVFFGTEGMTVSIGGTPITNPSIWYVVGIGGILLVLIGIPFGMLLTPQAKREFGVEPNETNSAEGN